MRKPPTVGPMARPTAAIPVQIPMARALRLGFGNAALTRASEATLTVAAPTPCRPRPRLRTNRPGATAQMAEATEKITVPAMYTFRRPYRSAIVAADMMNMPIVRL